MAENGSRFPFGLGSSSHFGTLAGLPPQQTSLIYFDGKALYNGPLLGTLKHCGDDFVLMGIPRGTRWIRKHDCLFVEVQPESQTGKPVRHVGRLMRPKPFVSQFFSLVEHYRIRCSTTKSVIVIGEKNR